MAVLRGFAALPEMGGLMKRFLVLAAFAAAAAFPASAQELRWKAVSFLPLTQSFGVHFKRWVDEFNTRGKGVMQIDAVGPEAIPVPEQPNAVKSGVIQMHYGPPTFYTGTMWEGESLSLSERTIKELRANGAWAYLDKLHQEKMNSVLLAGLGDGVKFFIYTTTPAKADDKDKPMTGLTLRSVPLYRVFFESLGARSVSLPPGEVFTALERKVVQGYGWPLWGIEACFNGVIARIASGGFAHWAEPIELEAYFARVTDFIIAGLHGQAAAQHRAPIPHE